jgi:hypothetical protein
VKRINEVIDYLSQSWHRINGSVTATATMPTLGKAAGGISLKSQPSNSASTSQSVYRCDIVRSQHSITLFFPVLTGVYRPGYNPPPIQIVLRLYSNPAEVLMVYAALLVCFISNQLHLEDRQQLV